MFVFWLLLFSKLSALIIKLMIALNKIAAGGKYVLRLCNRLCEK